MDSKREKLGKPKEIASPNLDYQCSIVVEEEELGKQKSIIHEEREITFNLPLKIDKKTVIPIKGYGKTEGTETGNLLIHAWLNKGENVSVDLWLSESSARIGTTKSLWTTQGRFQILVPNGSFNGSVIRMKGFGKEAEFGADAPFHNGKRGNLLVKLRTYPDYIIPMYRSFDSLDTDSMALEGWVYRKKDEIISKMGKSILNILPIIGDTIADIFNEKGLKAIFDCLVDHYKLTYLNIKLEISDSISKPGICHQQGSQDGFNRYIILINIAFIDNPFCIAAILAHELAHVIYSENFKDIEQQCSFKDDKEQTLEQERMVDLLVFMYRLGGFQIRVSRDRNITMGYFNQETFDRMYVIVLKVIKKLKKDKRA